MHNQERNFWNTINPICLLRRLLGDLPTILAAGLAAAMLASAVVQFFYSPVYTSSATVAVNVKSADFSAMYSDLSASSEIAETLTRLFENDVMRDIAKTQLGIADFPGKLTASVVPETNLLTLSITADTPEDAYNTLNLLLEHYDDISGQAFHNVVLKKLNPPVLPTAPSNPQNLRPITKKAFWGGCALLVVLILAISVLSDTIQTRSALRQKLDIKLLGTLHHETKNKTWKSWIKQVNKGLLITMPIASFRFTEEVHRISTAIENAGKGGQRPNKVVLITSTEENEGKSTVAANLALALAQNDKKVLLIDADLHKAAQYKIFETKPTCELADMLRGEAPYQPQHLRRYHLWALLSQQQSSDAAELIASQGMIDLLAKAREDMDYIILDTPPASLFSDVEVLADQADLSLLVVRQDTVPAERVNNTADILSQCRAKLLGCIFNDVRSSSVSSDSYGYGYGYGHYGYSYNGYGYGYGHYSSHGKYHRKSSEGVEETDGRA